MSETLKKKQPLPWWRRILLGLVLIAMALLAAFMLISYLAERQLGAEIVRISQAGEPITFLDLQAELEPSSTGEDASAYYAEALRSIRPDDLENLMRVNIFYRRNMLSLPASQFPGDVREEITQNLANFQPVLEKFDKGANLPLCRFDIGIEQGMQVYQTRLRHVRTAVALLSLRTSHLVLHGEDDAAVNSVISILKMIRIFDPHPTMALHGAKIASVGLACEDICLILELARPSEKSLAKLQKILSETIPANVLERMFFAERVYRIETARNLIPENIVLRFLQDKAPDLPERLPLPASRRGRLLVRHKSAQYLREMAQLIAAARRPWPEPLDIIVGNGNESTEKSSGLISSAAVFVRFTGETLASVRCTILAIAIERYRRSHGELPGSLDELFPIYIDSMPLDPFTGKKLLYSCDGETYVVYSVGINRQDDNGSIIPEADQKSPQDRGLRIRFHKPE